MQRSRILIWNYVLATHANVLLFWILTVFLINVKKKKQYNAFCLHSIVQHSSSYQNLKLRSSCYYQLWRQFPEVPAWSIILLHLDNYWYKYNIYIYCIGHGHSDCIDTTILQHSWREGKEMFYWNLWIHTLTLPLHLSYGPFPQRFINLGLGSRMVFW